jgi:hypothetical protein
MKCHFTKRRLLGYVLSAAIAALALAQVKVAQAVDHNVVWNSTNATANIQAGIDSGADRVILNYHSTPWITGPIYLREPNQELWIAGGATVEAIKGVTATPTNFGDLRARMFEVQADNVTINGYNNGTSRTSGVATIRMFKNDYIAAPYEQNTNMSPTQPGEFRHIIAVGGYDNITLQGLNLMDAGGDGICIAKYSSLRSYAFDVFIEDVVCDGNFRQGMSIVGGSKVYVWYSDFKNTDGTAPQAGVDIEPDLAGQTVSDIRFMRCKFFNNSGNNFEVNLQKLRGPNQPPVSILLQDCEIYGGSKNGLLLSKLYDDGPTGTVTIRRTPIHDTNHSGVYFGSWNYNKIAVTFDDVDITNVSNGWTNAPFIFSTAITPVVRTGDINFINGCSITDDVTSRAYIMGGSATQQSAGFQDITGTIDINRLGTNPKTSFGTNTSNITLTVT